MPRKKGNGGGFEAELAQALSHPLRVTILMRMNTPKRELSPSDYAEESGVHLSTCSYHFRQLSRYGLIRETRTAQVRGATEHFYEPVKRAMAWTRAYGAMPDAVKQNLAATALEGAVLSIGTSVDAGTFDAREDSHLSYDQMKVDAEGWERIIAVFNQALLDAIAIRDEALERLEGDEGAETFFASYLMSCWEAAPPDHPTPCDEGYRIPRLDQLACFPRPELVRLLETALEGMRAQSPDSYPEDYMEMRGEVERLLTEAGSPPKRE